MRKVVSFFEKKVAVGSIVSGRGHAAKVSSPRLEDQGQRLYMDVLVGKGHSQKIVYSSRGIVGILGIQSVRDMEDSGWKDEQSLPENCGVQVVLGLKKP